MSDEGGPNGSRKFSSQIILSNPKFHTQKQVVHHQNEIEEESISYNTKQAKTYKKEELFEYLSSHNVKGFKAK